MESPRRFNTNLLGVFVIIAVLVTGFRCDAQSSKSNIDSTTVNVEITEAGRRLRLVCPLPKTVARGRWTMTSSNISLELFKHDVRIYLEDSLSLRINTCDENNYSLEIASIVINHNDGEYICWKNNESVKSFDVVVRVRPILRITHNREQLDGEVRVTEGTKLHLVCDVRMVIPPVTITWYRNGLETEKDSSHLGDKRELSNYTSALTFDVTNQTEDATCSVQGAAVTTQSTTVLIQPISEIATVLTASETPSPPLAVHSFAMPLFVTGIGLVFASIAVLVACFVVHQRNRLAKGIIQNELRSVRDPLPQAPEGGCDNAESNITRYSQYEPVKDQTYADISDYATKIDNILLE